MIKQLILKLSNTAGWH